MDRLLVIYSSEATNRPTSAETARNLILDHLKTGRNDVVKWTNPEKLEFQIVDFGNLTMRFYAKTGNPWLLPKVLRGDSMGIKFFRKVPNQPMTYRLHFVPRHLLPKIPRPRNFTEYVKLSVETAV